jgi:Rap1a immunity proteins
MRSLWLILVLSACGVASAQTTKEYAYESGNAFLRVCSSVEKEQRTPTINQDDTGCILYIAGFVQGVEIGNTATMLQLKPTPVPLPFCRPEGVETGQLVKIVLKYIRENPEDAHHDTMMIALWAFQKAFPCSK